MYHIGKVLNILIAGKEVVSADESVQAVIEMWDKNILTFIVHPKIVKEVKKDSYVLVDYRSINEKLPVPRHLIIKVLKGKTAEDVWKHYKKFLNDKQKTKIQQPPTMIPQYFG